MKPLLLIGLTIFSAGSTGLLAAIAQTNPKNPATTPIPSLPVPLLQAAPLVQASSKLLGQQHYQIESEIELTLNLTDAPLVTYAQILTTVAAPNQVNAEISFVEESGESKQEYQVVSNGTQVWIYDLLQNQYSVSEYNQFIQSEEGLAVGTLSSFYLKSLNSVNNRPIASRTLAKLPPDQLLRYFQKFANIDLQNIAIRTEQIKAKNYTIYDIDATDRTFKGTVYVNSQSADIERVDLSGKKDGLDITIKEQVISQMIPETIQTDIFNFSPPKDAEEVAEQIAIAPFKYNKRRVSLLHD